MADADPLSVAGRVLVHAATKLLGHWACGIPTSHATGFLDKSLRFLRNLFKLAKKVLH